MIRISDAQMAAFTQASQADFERSLLRGLSEQFPACASQYPEAALGAMVRLGIDKAKRHGLESAQDVQCYLWLMLLFGSEWERDPQYAWAAAVLAAVEGTVAQRIGRVWAQAQAWRGRVMGGNQALHAAAVRYLAGKSVEDLCKNASRSQRDLLQQLAVIHPRKFAEVGEPSLFDLTRAAVEECRRFDLVDRWAVVLMTELMFLLGSGFTADPLYAWAGEALRRGDTQGVDQKLQALHAAAINSLAQ